MIRSKPWWFRNRRGRGRKHKLIRFYAVSDAAVHDSQELDGLLHKGNTCNDEFADSAYRSTEIEAQLSATINLLEKAT
jgi:hypothetical protein